MTAFLVWCPEQGERIEDAVTVTERDAEDAAIYWGETQDFDSADDAIARGESYPLVCVVERETPGAAPKWYRVTGEYRPSYYANEEEPTP